MADDVGPRPTLRIQTVLFRQSFAGVSKLAESLSRAVEMAIAASVIRSAALHIGDSSPTPVIQPQGLEQLRAAPWARVLAEVAYRPFDRNLGHGGGHNVLAEDFTEDLLLLINPDSIAHPRLLAHLLAPLSRSDVGIVEARQLPFEHPKEWDTQTGDTPWASFACALIRGEVFRSVGPLDAASFFLHCDDVDYSWRTRLAGYRIVHQPSARVFHDKRMTPEGAVLAGEQERRYAALGRLMLAHKYSRPDLIAGLLERLSTGTPEQRRAAAEFEERVRNGDVPDPLDPEGRVATFVNGQYAVHRF